MKKENISLYEILDGREKRVLEIKKLNYENKGIIICFTVNIPGPYKLSNEAKFIFDEGILQLEKALNIKVKKIEKRLSGFEGYFICNDSVVNIKKITTNLECTHELGRLFDIDVFYKDLKKISREDIKYSIRKCLICNEDAVKCSRSRKHSVKELSEYIANLIENYKKTKNKL